MPPRPTRHLPLATPEQLRELAGKPTIAELMKEIRKREPYTGPSSAALVREDRDAR